MTSVPPPLVSLDRSLCGTYAEASSREWLETNGLGGYALGTVAGANTRRYHGWLTVARRPPLERFQLVNRVEEAVFVGRTRLDLGCQEFPGIVHPRGVDRLESFRLDPYPVWTYNWGDGRLEKSFFLRYGENTGVIAYRLIAGPPVEMEIQLLFSLRDHHALGGDRNRFEGSVSLAERAMHLAVPGGGTLAVMVSSGRVGVAPAWRNEQVYAEEVRRGYDGKENVFCPGFARAPLSAGQPLFLVFSLDRREWPPVESWEAEEKDQRARLARGSLVRGPLGAALSAAADRFIVSRGDVSSRRDGASVMAGYPWFGDWSRDALISFPGLFLATGRWSEGPGLLDTFARHVRNGLLPNHFPEGGEPLAYNAVDAPLWFIRAVQAYHRATHDDEAVRRWLPVMRDIVDAYQNGTDQEIQMEGDGLITAPAGSLALTWMDARVDGKPATPRGGKAVEIQALWYNALQFLVEIQLKWKEPTRGYDQLAQVARKSFNEKFWNAEGQYMYDVVEGKRRDAAVRPNGLFAVSLPYEILEEKRFLPAVETARRELHTPLGLRTLAPGAPGYRGRYAGAPAERDAAYHQGTAWPWLLGPFLTAYVKAHGSTEETKKRLGEFLQPLGPHLRSAGVGQVSELADGDAPHSPGGCPAQAWSVAEILRVMWEEGLTL
jgi:predicted glycogen debranching enzyme